ncbi:MAG: hypothetical protein WD226_09555 [Planctomycetota bacterium]
MNSINRAATSLFDVLFQPFELLGEGWSLILWSSIFGVLALLVFKHISSQKGIKAAKDKIKGHMIAIRLYQDDLAIVAQSVTKVLGRNVQYLFLNFGPILPLMLPFTIVAAQFVVRYAFDPLPVQASEQLMPGQGTLVEISLHDGERARIAGLTLELPSGVEALSPLVRDRVAGRAWQEVVCTAPVHDELRILLDGQEVGRKAIVAGTERPRHMQPERVANFFEAWLWPAEETYAGSPVAKVKFAYPDHDLGWLPGGTGGVLLVFILASIAAGVLALKPLKIQI